MRGSRGRGGTGGPNPPVKSQVAIGFLRNSGTDPPREAIGPLGPSASRGGFVRPSVKYDETTTTNRKKHEHGGLSFSVILKYNVEKIQTAVPFSPLE